MKRIAVECLSEAPNFAVIKLPERKFPGIVIQGDSLSIMADLAREIEQAVRDLPDGEVRSAAEELSRQLCSRLEHYEQALDGEHMDLPYARRAVRS